MPCASINGITSRATNGKVTNTVATTIPGMAKITLRSCSANHGPNHPLAPNSNTHTKPAITGDTANGRSISEINNARPRNRNLVNAHAAASPKAVFNGTEIAAAVKVSRTADHAAGSRNAAKYTSPPRRNASLNTTTNGNNKNRHNTATASAISSQRTGADSVVTGRMKMSDLPQTGA